MRPIPPFRFPARCRSGADGEAVRRARAAGRPGARPHRRLHAPLRHLPERRTCGSPGYSTSRPGKGPFPVLVLNHGYIDPAIYVNGQGLMREQDYLAREGYVVLHTDYRNHAASDDDPRSELRLRLGYTEDVINAVLARQAFAARRTLDGERVGLLGRSMGGGVTYNVLVAQPGLVDAAVVFAPVSSNTADNFDRWIRGDARAGATCAERIIATLRRRRRRNPAFWRDGQPRHVLRPGDRAGAGPPRDGRRQLPDPRGAATRLRAATAPARTCDSSTTPGRSTRSGRSGRCRCGHGRLLQGEPACVSAAKGERKCWKALATSE